MDSESSSMKYKRKFIEGSSLIMKETGGERHLFIKGNSNKINIQDMVVTFVKTSFMLALF